jgi:hypothetical protein
VAHKLFGTFLVALVVTFSSFGVAAESIGLVVKVTPGATLSRSGKTSDLLGGQSLSAGDVISTNRSGQVQMLFNDETRIAIGPNASLAIDDIRMKQNGTARKFAVSAVAGGFRFLSGHSPKSAYSIKTPTATMGIRGTAFDFVVRNRAATDIIIFSGLVHMCGVSGSCFRVAGECSAVRMNNSGTAHAIVKSSERRNMISDGFLFMTRQESLSQDFRTDLRSCGRDTVVRPAARHGDDRPERSAPEAPEKPERGVQ